MPLIVPCSSALAVDEGFPKAKPNRPVSVPSVSIRVWQVKLKPICGVEHTTLLSRSAQAMSASTPVTKGPI